MRLLAIAVLSFTFFAAGIKMNNVQNLVDEVIQDVEMETERVLRDPEIVSVDGVVDRNDEFCQLVPTMTRTYTDYGYYPFYTKLKKCRGTVRNENSNQQNWKCSPSKKSNLKLRLSSVSVSGKKKIVILQEDSSCKAECIVACTGYWTKDDNDCKCKCSILNWDGHDWSPHLCSDANKQYYDAQSCGCKCKTVSNCPSTKSWDENNCACSCKSSCPEGTVQDKDNCHCIAASKKDAPLKELADTCMDLQCNEKLERKNDDSCKCECRVPEEAAKFFKCSSGMQKFNVHDCKCKCEDIQYCPSQKIWDDVNCRCKCRHKCPEGKRQDGDTCHCLAKDSPVERLSG